jgi:serine/threonine protein phosphatase 1
MIYVTSDLHGYPLEKFREMLGSVGFSDDDFLYVLGDVIDRGPHGIKILRWLMSKHNAQLIIGNHEKMMLDCEFIIEEITNDFADSLNPSKLNTLSLWLANSGGVTVQALKAVRDSEIRYIYEYLNDAPYYEVVTAGDRDFLLVHGGLKDFREDKKLSEYSEHDLVWSRPEPDERYFSDVYTVIGHTPTVKFGEEFRGRAYKTDTWIDIDTGAGWGLKPMLLRLDDMQEFYFD